jgi:hypothetical protein
MQALRFGCVNPGGCLRPFAARLCMAALLAAQALAGVCLLHGQAQQPAAQNAAEDLDHDAQANSGQANDGQAGAQNNPQQQNGGSSVGAPMVLGEGDSEESPGEQAPAGPPAAQTVSAQPEQNAASPQQEAAQPAALPPRPPDSSDPRRLVDWECADLLKLANDLKVAVDKTTKDELSLSVVRKASEIEQMAHKLRDDMRPAMAGKN